LAGWCIAEETGITMTAGRLNILRVKRVTATLTGVGLLAAVITATLTPPARAAATSTPAAPANLIANPSVEHSTDGATPTGWSRGYWGTNSRQFSYSSNAHTGSKSVTVTISSYTSGTVKWYPDPVAVTAGQAYDYSDWYESNVATGVVVAFIDSSGNYKYANLPTAPASTSWEQYNAKFTVPAGTMKLSVYHSIGAVGSLTLDDVSLMSDNNLIANPSVEQSTDGATPTNWLNDSWGTNTTTFSYSNDGHTGAKSVRTSITSYSSGAAKWYFKPVAVQGNQSYLFSAWLKTNIQPYVTVSYQMQDGTTRYERAPTPLVTATAATTWQNYTTVITAPVGAQSVTVLIAISNTGWLETDDYSLTAYQLSGFNKPLVSLTFDDGLLSTYTNGLPLLQKYGLVSTEYIVSGKIGTASHMTVEQIGEFQNEGSEIASHTVDHPDLTTLNSSHVDTELSQSQATLRQLFGSNTATDFASPYGQYNYSVIAAVKQYYRSHRSIDAGFNSKETFDPYDILVQNVNSDTLPAEVAGWVDHAIATKTWLVLVYHGVEDQIPAGDQYDVSTSNLDTELGQIKASGVKVVTMNDALNEITPQLPGS
jgi:peptidoglycan/xylan/chitin deacetylase (PgdA/CDA1 family)